MTRARWAIALVFFVACIVRNATSASAAGTITSFTKTSAGSIAFVVPDLSSAAQPGSPAYGFALQVKTTALPGSITIAAPAITGTAGNSISKQAFFASCAATSDPGGIFTSSGMVRLGVAAVQCATIASNKNNTVNFTVTLYLDDTDDATAFTADTYASGTLAVTANAP